MMSRKVPGLELPRSRILTRPLPRPNSTGFHRNWSTRSLRESGSTGALWATLSGALIEFRVNYKTLARPRRGRLPALASSRGKAALAGRSRAVGAVRTLVSGRYGFVRGNGSRSPQPSSSLGQVCSDCWFWTGPVSRTHRGEREIKYRMWARSLILAQGSGRGRSIDRGPPTVPEFASFSLRNNI